MLGTAAVEELWQPHGTAKVKALKKRARRIRQEEPEYLRDLWAHCRAEEESTTEGSSTTESAPLEEQQAKSHGSQCTIDVGSDQPNFLEHQVIVLILSRDSPPGIWTL
ncbi:uncharacterized protein LOC115090698 isoform X2 [Rhinatrema bivittatum]|uniref:uncharacterized protein LOC115090698 isoform X2 n=1 Tax=Rhinatrema bivittatum TaxID=194408 RepID=UPI0011278941|nr:uncharacterized protein LOC115090698 isoform X2 [Rhinatrema bivittatum]